MKKFFLLFLGCFLLACVSEEKPAEYSSSKDDIHCEKLITPQTLLNWIQREEKPHLLIVQVSPEEVYATEHLDQAHQIWRPDFSSDVVLPYGGMLAPKEKLEQLLQDLGMTTASTLVLYDAKGNVDAARFAWVLKYYGVDQFVLLNGGLTYWKQLGYGTTDLLPAPATPSTYILSGRIDDSILANKEDVLAAFSDTNIVLVDTREAYEYLGQPFVSKGQIYRQKKGAVSHGSIPAAIHFNWSTMVDLNGDHRIKCERDLRHDLSRKGILPEKQIILYCHSGSRTSHTHFVLTEILNFPNVRNYDGSWLEWSYLHQMDSTYRIQQLTPRQAFEQQYLELQRKLKIHG